MTSPTPSQRSKLMTAREAVERFVRDGDTVYTGFSLISFELTHEIIRQGRKHLKAVSGSDVQNVTVLAVAGSVDRLETGYVSGVLGSAPMREMMQDGRLRYTDYTNMTMALRFMAGAMGMPFIPANSFLGTDYLTDEVMDHPNGLAEDRRRPDGSVAPPYAVIDSPFDGSRALLYPAIRPDVAIFHCQRADEEGNIQAWGPLADAKYALWAAERVLVTAEEIVPRSVIASEPGMTVLPGFRTSAVVHCPWGAHPAPVTGYYYRDTNWPVLTGSGMRDWDGAQQYLDEWVYGTKDREDYIAKFRESFGDDLLDMLKVRQRLVPERPAHYGWR